MKKQLLQKSASQSEKKTSMDIQPGRDENSITLPISAITITHNPRTDLGDLSELKTSIAEKGMLNPLLVLKTEMAWELLGGHRRLECVKQLGWDEVPCRVVNTGVGRQNYRPPGDKKTDPFLLIEEGKDGKILPSADGRRQL